MTYSGELSIEPNQFSVPSAKIDIGEGTIHFDFPYVMPEEPDKVYDFSGDANLCLEGHYMSESISYPDTDGEGTIYILKAQPENGTCNIEGFWYETSSEGTGVWRISGTLKARDPGA